VSLGIRIAAKGVVGIILIVTAVAGWCALTEIAGGAMYENCTIPTFELCVQEVIAGNRGFCIPNRAGRPPGRRPGSRAASGSASTTEGTLSRAGSSLSQLTQRQAGHIAGPGGCGFVLAREAGC
jgi:hypothetical protein